MLTRLTWLIDTSVLRSNWYLGKLFAPTGQLGQAHTVKKGYFWNLSMRKPFSFNSFYLQVLSESHKFSNKMTKWKKIGNMFFTIWTWPNWPIGAKILLRFQFEGKTDVWISQIRGIKRDDWVVMDTWIMQQECHK